MLKSSMDTVMQILTSEQIKKIKTSLNKGGKNGKY